MESKNSNIIYILVGVLLACVIGLGGFIIYDKTLKDNEIKENTDSALKDNENYKIDLSNINFKGLEISPCLPDCDSPFKNSENLISNLDGSIILNLFFSDLESSTDMSNYHPIYTKNQIKDKWINALGPNANEQFELFFNSYFEKADNGKYTINLNQAVGFLSKQKFQKLEFNNNLFILYVSVVFDDNESPENISPNYKYIFKKNNDKYYFYSIEKI